MRDVTLQDMIIRQKAYARGSTLYGYRMDHAGITQLKQK